MHIIYNNLNINQLSVFLQHMTVSDISVSYKLYMLVSISVMCVASLVAYNNSFPKHQLSKLQQKKKQTKKEL